jgi:hypothetical protein
MTGDVILNYASTPKVQLVDTTDNVTTRLSSGNTVGVVGTYSAHPLSIVTDSTTKLKIDVAGNVGISVTPSSWPTNGDFRGLQVGSGLSVYGRGAGDEDRVGMTANAYMDQTNSRFEYIGTGHATHYSHSDGQHIFQVAPGGTADNPITFSTVMTINNDGIVTKPLQPAFSAYANTAQNNISTAYSTVTFDTERFDQNADFNTSTHTFTAPVTGKYLFAACVGLKAIPLNCQWIFMRILTSNAGYNMSEETAKWDADTSNGFPTGFASTVLADMDAGDTAKVDIYQYTGTIATDISTGAGYTWFTGYLVA